MHLNTLTNISLPPFLCHGYMYNIQDSAAVMADFTMSVLDTPGGITDTIVGQ